MDRYIDGLGPGDFILLGGRPQTGCTTLVNQIAVHVASVEQKTVAIYQYEMSKRSAVAGLSCVASKITSDALDRGLKDDKDWTTFATAVENLKTLPILIEGPCERHFEEFLNNARNLKEHEPNLGLIILDGLDQMVICEEGDKDIDLDWISMDHKEIGSPA